MLDELETVRGLAPPEPLTAVYEPGLRKPPGLYREVGDRNPCGDGMLFLLGGLPALVFVLDAVDFENSEENFVWDLALSLSCILLKQSIKNEA